MLNRHKSQIKTIIKYKLVQTVLEDTKRVIHVREQRDLFFGSMIGATVFAIIASSAVHFVRTEPVGFERLLIGGISGGLGGVIGLFIISEIVGQKWFVAVLLSLAVGVVDGFLVGAALALFPSVF